VRARRSAVKEVSTVTGRFRRLVSAAVALLAVLFALGAALALTGQNAIVITHGVSMNPVYYQGDLVVVQRKSAYRTGEIVAYRRPDIHLVVLHRIIAGDPSGWTFKGDNNQSIDPTHPAQSQLIGRAVLHIPRGGIWLRRLTATPLLAAGAFLLLLGGSAAAGTRRQRRRKDLRTMSPRHRAKPCRALGSLPLSLRPVAAGALVLGALGAALSGVAWTRPTWHPVTASGLTPSMRFSYVAHVRPSPAYDGTTVVAPQPVFRRITDQVDVSYAYAGPPGALSLTVELSTSGGWRTSIPVSSATIGRAYDGRVHLDLAALQARADAAARTTGLPAGEVSVTVVPRVSLAGGVSFAPRLALSLTALTLKPTSDLTARGSAAPAGHGGGPARIALLGHGLTVSRARATGAVALLLSLLAGAVLMGIARITGPVAEADRVRARHGDLILPVLPIVLAAGRPVVDVPDIESLARLARRYGLLMLHWDRGGVDTYVVQDESVTYRYRTGGRPAQQVAEEEPAPA
jgi:signal peptidase I